TWPLPRTQCHRCIQFVGGNNPASAGRQTRHSATRKNATPPCRGRPRGDFHRDGHSSTSIPTAAAARACVAERPHYSGWHETSAPSISPRSLILEAVQFTIRLEFDYDVGARIARSFIGGSQYLQFFGRRSPASGVEKGPKRGAWVDYMFQRGAPLFRIYAGRAPCR